MRGLEKNCSRWRRPTDRQTHRHTDGHGDSMTNSAQWGQVGENLLDALHSTAQFTGAVLEIVTSGCTGFCGCTELQPIIYTDKLGFKVGYKQPMNLTG